MEEAILGIGITIAFFAVIIFSFKKYMKRMKNKKVEVPHCGGCDAGRYR